MRVLVTGATGFIGRNMIERFAANDNFEVTGTYFNSTPYNISGVKMAHANLTLKEDVEHTFARLAVFRFGKVEVDGI